MVTLDVVVEGTLFHYFIIALDEKTSTATFYGNQGILNGNRFGHSKIQQKYKLDFDTVLGGGDCAILGQDKETLSVGGYSETFGAVPLSLLEVFSNVLLARYQTIIPELRKVTYDPRGLVSNIVRWENILPLFDLPPRI